MRYFLCCFILFGIFSCAEEPEKKSFHTYNEVTIEEIYNDSVSIRSLEILNDGSLAFAGSDGKYGLYDPKTGVWNTKTILGDTINPYFRATAHTATDFFMLSIGNPALLYKTSTKGMKLVYAEENEQVFYDAIKFWNNEEGIAMGDPTEDCLSVIITRNGGKTWSKLPCDQLPETKEGEAAFAASNTNIATMGDKTWILTGGKSSRVYYSPDKGQTWEVFKTPITQGTATQGGYSIDFYDGQLGFAIGGDYTQPELNEKNKMRTVDGGKTWEIVAKNEEPGYKSCVQFIPKHEGNELVAVGFTGISYSKDRGESWQQLSQEGFFTLRFLNDSIAYAAGNGRVAKLTFSNSESDLKEE